MSGADQSDGATATSGWRSRHRFRQALFAATTIVVTSLLTYYVCEAVYRYLVFRKLSQAQFHPDLVTISPLDQFDERTGFRYVARTRTRLLKLDKTDGRILFDTVVHTNNMGHVSEEDDRYAKPAGEFRIAILGDSFTAAREMRRPWPDLVEELLNQDRQLVQQLGVSHLEVVNFGRDGIGVIQCAAIQQAEVTQYDVDLVVLNVIAEDFFRRFQFRRLVQRDVGHSGYQVAVHSPTLPCTLENSESATGTVSLPMSELTDEATWLMMRQDLNLLQLHRVPWFSLYPELLAWRAGRFIGLTPRLFSSYSHQHFEDRQEGFLRNVQACHEIEAACKELVILYLPGPKEFWGEVPEAVDAIREFGPRLDITSMRDYLPTDIDDAELRRWYIPGDGHFSDYGGNVYAQSVFRKLKDHLTADYK